MEILGNPKEILKSQRKPRTSFVAGAPPSGATGGLDFSGGQPRAGPPSGSTGDLCHPLGATTPPSGGDLTRPLGAGASQEGSYEVRISIKNYQDSGIRRFSSLSGFCQYLRGFCSDLDLALELDLELDLDLAGFGLILIRFGLISIGFGLISAGFGLILL